MSASSRQTKRSPVSKAPKTDLTALYQQYMVCLNRGHTPLFGSDSEAKHPQKQCKFCKTIYWTEQHETNVPTPVTTPPDHQRGEIE